MSLTPRPLLALALGLVLAVAHPAEAHVGAHEVLREAETQAERHPDDPAVQLLHARAHLLAGEWTAALAALDLAARRGADADEVGAVRAAVFLRAGSAKRAKRELDHVLARRPDAYALLFERGRACLALGRPDKAARDFGRAIAGMPAPQPEHVIARRDALLSLGRTDAAVRALDEGMVRLGPVASLQLSAVELDRALGHRERALHRLDVLLAQAANPFWVTQRGDILAEAGRTTEARGEYLRARDLIAARRGPAFAALGRRLDAALATTTEKETPR